MSLEVLPTRSAGAAENMAVDFLLLQHYPRPQQPRFRHYGWRNAAFTFGYSQKIEFVRAALPAGEVFDVCRRPTGGGIVDHRDDWTFSLVIPRGHPLEDVRATQSYREIHECLASALRLQGVPAETKNTAVAAVSLDEAAPSTLAEVPLRAMLPGVCFERAELYDVVHATSGAKIAGAAQKRNKRGLLFQGSLWRPALGQTIDEEQLGEDFIKHLAQMLQTTSAQIPWPELNEDEVSGLTETYASTDWNEAR
ncbi:MAG: lipoate--protein ligase family protein [Opitutus sp.]